MVIVVVALALSVAVPADLDPAVNPGASTYPTVPMMPGAKPGTKPFDYDCDSTEDPDPSQFVTQCGVGLSGPEADCARTCAGGTGDGRSPGPGFAPGSSVACGTPAPLGYVLLHAEHLRRGLDVVRDDGAPSLQV